MGVKPFTGKGFSHFQQLRKNHSVTVHPNRNDAQLFSSQFKKNGWDCFYIWIVNKKTTHLTKFIKQ